MGFGGGDGLQNVHADGWPLGGGRSLFLRLHLARWPSPCFLFLLGGRDRAAPDFCSGDTHPFFLFLPLS